MPELSPATFKSMNEVMRDMMLPNVIESCEGDVEAAKEMIESMMPAENVMYVVSNEQKMHGATSIINPVLMDQIAEQVGDNYFILPSSLHECLVVPREAGMDYKELEAMVKEVNATQVSVEDRLSDHVYAYDAVHHEIYLADQEQEHFQARAAEKAEDKSRGADAKRKPSIKEKLAAKQKTVEQSKKDAPARATGRKREEVLA